MKITRVDHGDIGSGDSAVTYTVRKLMCRLARRDAADPRIVRLAEGLKEGKSDRDAVRAALQYVVRRIRYVNDPDGIELVRAPIHTLLGSERTGDCDCMCTALAALLLAMGYGVKFRVIAHSGSPRNPSTRKWEFSHVDMVAVLPGGREIALDPVMEQSSGNGFDNTLSDIQRKKFYGCDMKAVTLEGLGCTSCGGRCGGRCRQRRSSCCPQNGQHQGGVVVNVNTGTQNRQIDYNSSTSSSTNLNRSHSNNRTSSRHARESVARETSAPTRLVAPAAEPAPAAAQPAAAGDVAVTRRRRERFMEFL